MVRGHLIHVTVFLAMAFITPTLVQGTSECYQCVHVDGYDIDKLTGGIGIKSEKACKKGNKLGDFAVKCDSSDAWINDSKITKLAKNTSLAQEKSYACGRVSVKGNVGTKKVEVVLRTCLRSNAAEDWEDKCLATSVAKLLSGEVIDFDYVEELKELVDEMDISKDTDIGTCICTGENCNSAVTTSGIISFAVVLAFATKLF